eukprot:scaffold162596_cov24-Tisochrysis_lutea.AAC.5
MPSRRCMVATRVAPKRGWPPNLSCSLGALLLGFGGARLEASIPCGRGRAARAGLGGGCPDSCDWRYAVARAGGGGEHCVNEAGDLALRAWARHNNQPKAHAARRAGLGSVASAPNPAHRVDGQSDPWMGALPSDGPGLVSRAFGASRQKPARGEQTARHSAP